MSYPHHQQGRPACSPFPAPTPPPPSAAGIVAALFALGLGGLATLGTLLGYWTWWHFSADIREMVGTESWMVWRPLAALLLVTGGILLLRRLTVGRALVITGIVAQSIETISVWREYPARDLESLIWMLGVVGFYLTVVILAAHPSTTRWIRTREYPATQAIS
ncbi:hypothetical protein [Nocardia concava]|uniref:hypothetical protein n=1 Tax=Nocardia concava TaxID=257281 RepID=UPI0002E6E155|nr:hypothetical protein [Nocardia concava]